MNALRTLPFRAAIALPLLLVAIALAACDDDPNPNHRAAIFDVASGDWRHISDADDFANVVTWSPDSRSVVVIEGDDDVSRDAASGSEHWRVEGKESAPVREAAYSPGGETVAVLRLHEALNDGAGTSVELVSAEDGTGVEPGTAWSVSGEAGTFVPIIHDLAWATDGRMAVIGLRGSTTDPFRSQPGRRLVGSYRGNSARRTPRSSPSHRRHLRGHWPRRPGVARNWIGRPPYPLR